MPERYQEVISAVGVQEQGDTGTQQRPQMIIPDWEEPWTGGGHHQYFSQSPPFPQFPGSSPVLLCICQSRPTHLYRHLVGASRTSPRLALKAQALKGRLLPARRPSDKEGGNAGAQNWSPTQPGIKEDWHLSHRHRPLTSAAHKPCLRLSYKPG